MTGAEGLLLGLVIMLALGLVYVVYTARREIARAEEIMQAERVRETEHRAALNRQAEVYTLRAMAHRWDSVEEQPLLKRLAANYTPGGPSMPVIWLSHYADLIENGDER